MTDYRLLYITCADLDQARRIGRALVEERLAACANILPGMQSIYRWEGAIHEDTEVVLITKTLAAQVDPLIARVLALHTYTTPCIVALPILAGNPAYLQWLADESR